VKYKFYFSCSSMHDARVVFYVTQTTAGTTNIV